MTTIMRAAAAADITTSSIDQDQTEVARWRPQLFLGTGGLSPRSKAILTREVYVC